VENQEDDFENKLNERIKREEEKKQSEKEKNNYKLTDKRSDENIDDEFDKKEKLDEQEEADDVDLTAACISEYANGRYSPTQFLSVDELDLDTLVMNQEEDEKRLEIKRQQVLGTGALKPDVEDEFELKARDTMGGIIPTSLEKEMDTEETNKNDERKSNTVEVEIKHHYQWSDKYRPRKPRYYNRVHTGYDWNQYNKKHYDVDNPPPKTVQGYKFNVIFLLLKSHFSLL
jgi:hypothetical protein